MEPRIAWRSESFKQDVKSNLKEFAEEGLRTLVMGRKPLPVQEFDRCFKKITELETSNDYLKDQKLLDFYDSIETNLEYLGASAIEDKL